MTTRRAVILVALVVVLILGAFGAWRYSRYRARRAAEVAHASIERCLLGTALTSGEGASARIHRIALGNPPSDWPKRCDRYLTELGNHLDSAGRAADAADLRAKWGKGFDLAALERAPWELDDLVGTPSGAEPASDVPASPPPATLPDERTPILAKAALGALTSDALPGARLSLVLAPALLCTFDAEMTGAKCLPLGPKAPVGAQSFVLWPPTDDEAPQWLTDHLQKGERAQRFFRADTGLLVDAGSPDRAMVAYGYADGSVLTLSPSVGDERGYDLLHWRGKEHGQPYTLGTDAKRFLILGQRLVWVARADDDYDHVYSARLSTAPLRLGKPEDHGRMMAVSLEACRTKDALALVSTRGGETKVIFFGEQGASAIQIAKLAADARVPQRVLGCGEDDVTITRVVTRDRKSSDTDVMGFVVQHARCTADSCQVQEVDVDKMLEGMPEASRPRGSKESDVVAAGLGGKLAVVWRSTSRGVRMRLALPADLGQAPDQLLYDDGVQGGRAAHESTVSRMALLSRQRGAVLLLERIAEGGLVALGIKADGKVTPIGPSP